MREGRGEGGKEGGGGEMVVGVLEMKEWEREKKRGNEGGGRGGGSE